MMKKIFVSFIMFTFIVSLMDIPAFSQERIGGREGNLVRARSVDDSQDSAESRMNPIDQSSRLRGFSSPTLTRSSTGSSSRVSRNREGLRSFTRQDSTIVRRSSRGSERGGFSSENSGMTTGDSSAGNSIEPPRTQRKTSRTATKKTTESSPKDYDFESMVDQLTPILLERLKTIDIKYYTNEFTSTHIGFDEETQQDIYEEHSFLSFSSSDSALSHATNLEELISYGLPGLNPRYIQKALNQVDSSSEMMSSSDESSLEITREIIEEILKIYLPERARFITNENKELILDDFLKDIHCCGTVFIDDEPQVNINWYSHNKAMDVIESGATQGADFSGMDLQRMDFSGLDLTGANFSRARLEGALFYGSVLGDASFKEANLTDAHFDSLDVSEADFRGSDFNHANFTNVVGVETLGMEREDKKKDDTKIDDGNKGDDDGNKGDGKGGNGNNSPLTERYSVLRDVASTIGNMTATQVEAFIVGVDKKFGHLENVELEAEIQEIIRQLGEASWIRLEGEYFNAPPWFEHLLINLESAAQQNKSFTEEEIQKLSDKLAEVVAKMEYGESIEYIYKMTYEVLTAIWIRVEGEYFGPEGLKPALLKFEKVAQESENFDDIEIQLLSSAMALDAGGFALESIGLAYLEAVTAEIESLEAVRFSGLIYGFAKIRALDLENEFFEAADETGHYTGAGLVNNWKKIEKEVRSYHPDEGVDLIRKIIHLMEELDGQPTQPFNGNYYFINEAFIDDYLKYGDAILPEEWEWDPKKFPLHGKYIDADEVEEIKQKINYLDPNILKYSAEIWSQFLEENPKLGSLLNEFENALADSPIYTVEDAFRLKEALIFKIMAGFTSLPNIEATLMSLRDQYLSYPGFYQDGYWYGFESEKEKLEDALNRFEEALVSGGNYNAEDAAAHRAWAVQNINDGWIDLSDIEKSMAFWTQYYLKYEGYYEDGQWWGFADQKEKLEEVLDQFELALANSFQYTEEDAAAMRAWAVQNINDGWIDLSDIEKSMASWTDYYLSYPGFYENGQWWGFADQKAKLEGVLNQFEESLRNSGIYDQKDIDLLRSEAVQSIHNGSIDLSDIESSIMSLVNYYLGYAGFYENGRWYGFASEKAKVQGLLAQFEADLSHSGIYSNDDVSRLKSQVEQGIGNGSIDLANIESVISHLTQHYLSYSIGFYENGHWYGFIEGKAKLSGALNQFETMLGSTEVYSQDDISRLRAQAVGNINNGSIDLSDIESAMFHLAQYYLNHYPYGFHENGHWYGYIQEKAMLEGLLDQFETALKDSGNYNDADAAAHRAWIAQNVSNGQILLSNIESEIFHWTQYFLRYPGYYEDGAWWGFADQKAKLEEVLDRFEEDLYNSGIYSKTDAAAMREWAVQNINDGWIDLSDIEKSMGYWTNYYLELPGYYEDGQWWGFADQKAKAEYLLNEFRVAIENSPNYTAEDARLLRQNLLRNLMEGWIDLGNIEGDIAYWTNYYLERPGFYQDGYWYGYADQKEKLESALDQFEKDLVISSQYSVEDARLLRQYIGLEIQLGAIDLSDINKSIAFWTSHYLSYQGFYQNGRWYGFLKEKTDIISLFDQFEKDVSASPQYTNVDGRLLREELESELNSGSINLGSLHWWLNDFKEMVLSQDGLVYNDRTYGYAQE